MRLSGLRISRSARAGIGLAAVTLAAALFFTAHRADTQRDVVLPDVPATSGGATLLPNGWTVTPAGTQIALPGDMPMTMALTPDGKDLLVNTAGFHDHNVDIIDTQSQALVQSFNVGHDWVGMGISPDGTQVYVCGANAANAQYAKSAAGDNATADQIAQFQAPVMRLALSNSTLSVQPGISIPGLTDPKRFITGLCVAPDGSVYVANMENDTLYKIDGTTHTVVGSVKVGHEPYAVSITPKGDRVAVTSWADATVSVLDPSNPAVVSTVKVGSHPIALAWAKDGRLFVANGGENTVSVVSGNKTVETIRTSIDPKAPIGSTPDAVAVSPDNTRLYVANADNNDVCVVDISNSKESRVLGFIPTAWYPSSLEVSPDGSKLYIGTGKGTTFGPNALPDTHVATPESLSDYHYIGTILSGTVSVVNVPDSAKLADYTQEVMNNTPKPSSGSSELELSASVGGNQADVLSRIKHVVYIIRENRTYDEDFGDIAKGNGDAKLTLFGGNVTPNAHKLANDFVLLDNLYCNGEVSENGHQWCDSAYATDYTDRAWELSYSGRGEPNDDFGLSQSPAGYLWDNCARHHISYRTYGEFSDFTSSPSAPPKFTGPKGLDNHWSYPYAKIDWFGEPRDLGRAQIFIDDLHQGEKYNNWPQFIVMSLPEDHTQGLDPGAWTPTANVGENDQALGKIVEAVSRSKYWSQTAIFVIEDDAQNGPDHVDAHRTVGLVISPYIRKGAVDSTFYTTASMVRTMELILGLPPMTQFDQDATPMYNSFTATPDLSAYDPAPARVDLEAKNPKSGSGETASLKLDLSAPDRADPDKLNAILWEALKPGVPLPAPVRSAMLPR